MGLREWGRCAHRRSGLVDALRAQRAPELLHLGITDDLRNGLSSPGLVGEISLRRARQH
jgi:hypothetical protein